jgi:hypothetical protein
MCALRRLRRGARIYFCQRAPEEWEEPSPGNPALTVGDGRGRNQRWLASAIAVVAPVMGIAYHAAYLREAGVNLTAVYRVLRKFP